MGTFIAIDAEAGSLGACESGIRAAFAAVAQVEALLHPSRHGSDLAAINAGAPAVPVTVHAWTWYIPALAKRLHRSSNGVFDPCVPASPGRLSELELLHQHGGERPRVVPHCRLNLDLGGIGKGFAVDRGIDALRAAGCHGGLVNAGGDLAVFGARRHDVLCCDARGDCMHLALRDAALATSDVAANARPAEHCGYYNGRDGQQVSSGRVAVTAPSAATAHALTKCLLADAKMNLELLDAFGARTIGG